MKLKNTDESNTSCTTASKEIERVTDEVSVEKSMETDLKTDIESAAYQSLYPIFQNGGFEYIDKSGNIVTDYKFDTANFFSEGFASVSREGKYGAIDMSANIKIPLSYCYLGKFSCGLAAVKNSNEKFGFIDLNNKIIIPYKYDFVKNFSENIAVVSEDNYDFVMVNQNGEELFTAECNYRALIGSFKNGLQRQGYSYYDIAGNCVISDHIYRMDAWEFLPGDFSDGLAVYPVINDSEWQITNDYDINYYMDSNNWKYKYIDIYGNSAFEDMYDHAENFSENLAVIEKNGQRGVIDNSGKLIYSNDTVYGQYSEGYITYYKETNGLKKYGFLDEKGNVSIDAQYDSILKNFTDGLALVKLNEMLMYIDYNGEIIYKFEEPEYKFWLY
ncbi:MAG: WG repeat-containing protein [Oscillospiraceae bacterium]